MSVTLVTPDGRDFVVSEPNEFVRLVYGWGYRPKAGTIQANLDSLQESTPAPGPGPEEVVRLGDLQKPDSAASAALRATFGSPDDVGYDIIPVIGQSNALGRGLDINLDYLDGPDSRVYQFANLSSPYPDQVVVAREPLFHQDLPGQTVGFALTFAKLYAQTAPVNRRVLLVPCARGGTGFASTGSYTWRVGETGASVNLHTLAVAQINKALALPGRNRVVAFLWHQGEANTGDAALKHANDLDTLIRDLRTRYGANVPFVLGQMSPERIASGAGYAVIDGVHRDTPKRLPHVGLWLASPNYNPSDPTHFSAAGQRYNGRAAFDAYRLALTPEGGIAPAYPRTVATPPVTPPAPGGTVTFSDDFARADAAVLGSTPVGNLPWKLTGTNAVGSIVGGAGSVTASPTSTIRVAAYLEPGLSNGVLRAKIKSGVQHGSSVALAWRFVDTSNYWMVTIISGMWSLYYRLNGTGVSVSPGKVTAADGDQLEVRFDGMTTVLLVNGVESARDTSTNQHLNATRVALVNTANLSPAPQWESIEMTTLPDPATRVLDDFARADNASSLGVANTGQSWVMSPSGTTWGITGGQAYVSSDAPANARAVIDSGISDGTVQVRFAKLADATTSGIQSRLVFRADASGTHFIVQWRPTVGWQMYKLTSAGGAFTQVGTTVGTPVAADGDLVQIVLAGPSITLKVNGATVITATDTFQQTATLHGIGTNGTGVARFDDFAVVAAA
jgi:hypothetical protein